MNDNELTTTPVTPSEGAADPQAVLVPAKPAPKAHMSKLTAAERRFITLDKSYHKMDATALRCEFMRLDFEPQAPSPLRRAHSTAQQTLDRVMDWNGNSSCLRAHGDGVVFGFLAFPSVFAGIEHRKNFSVVGKNSIPCAKPAELPCFGDAQLFTVLKRKLQAVRGRFPSSAPRFSTKY
jgi:hypothetical protein